MTTVAHRLGHILIAIALAVTAAVSVAAVASPSTHARPVAMHGVIWGD